MNQDLDNLEENLKKKDERKKKHSVSGRSVFELQKIIQQKSQDDNIQNQEKDEKQ